MRLVEGFHRGRTVADMGLLDGVAEVTLGLVHRAERVGLKQVLAIRIEIGVGQGAARVVEVLRDWGLGAPR